MERSIEQRLASLSEKLRKRGCRITPQRLAILRVLLSTPEHLRAEQIHAQLHADYPTTGLGTIYKTLAVLKEMGEILEIQVPGQGSRYDGINPQAHPHLICVRCNATLDLEIPALSVLIEQVTRLTGYQILDQRLDYFGLCPACQ
jgi:Fur family peroxide stress response transcriptional regulator